MKGIVCAETNRFEMLDNLPEPAWESGYAIVQIKRVGICGTDLHAYKGNQPFFTYPRILGHELAAIITKIGENQQGLRAGDQVSVIPYMHCGSCIACRNGKTNCCTDMKVLGVHIDGGMRERISIPVDRAIPTNGLTLDQTAVLEPLAIGAHAVRRSNVQPGETVLVIGGGPIGLGVMAIAKHSGAKVIAMDVNEERLSFCKTWAKADEIVNALHDPSKGILEVNQGELPTVVFDATGNAKSMSGAFQYVSHGGTLVFVGLVKSDIAFHDPEFHKRELTLMGSRNATREDFYTVMEALSAGAIDVSSYVTHRVPFADMIEHFESWLKPETKVIKAMLEL
ncbi:2-desacetyl-2-hydroxyethyl bacteriochlorophyllide A dehydrogenase [Paenibacillus sp. UNC496MF]|uniref:zinc-binding alcohol dehydrogenase family protein n=1 Tax=Paenibacillus sp. UNC496MF TaxID=1502753 RepID=UPI0008E5165D|nr:zinc-binding alcohol dehydrogenase family protein [Paenibacillus sp. UNC496MF]SFJ55473.1 2-desacetyl-2-hydroxyethyl bacteriochlorophyllide A dehydrogenase [Paenibacillus sp. UNC496MF]